MEEINNVEVPQINSEKSDEVEVMVIDTYEHGFVNGVLKIEKSFIQEFIKENGLKVWKAHELARDGSALRKNEAILENTLIQLQENQDIIISAEEEIFHLNEKSELTQNEIEKLEGEKNHLVNKFQTRERGYGWFSGLLFLAGAFVFMVTDIYIVQFVTFNMLSMEGFEGWIFATGIGTLTLIIKPAIDRIFEKPYAKGNRIKQNHGLLLFTALLSLVLAAGMGLFRLESVAAIFYGDDNAIKELVSSLMSSTIFSICGILFALGGAICMSLGVSSLECLIQKEWLRQKIKKIEKMIKLASDQYVQYKADIRNHIIKKRKAEFSTSLLPSCVELREDIAYLKNVLKDHLEAYYLHLSESDNHLYHDAYDRGMIYQLTDKLFITPSQIAIFLGSKMKQPRGNSSSKSKAQHSSKPRDGYLYEQLRGMIEYNHNRKKQILNGEK